MSYILDALKKSERERERGSLPSLSTTPRVPFDSRSGWTGAGLGAGALVCLAAAAWLVNLYWSQPRPAPDAAATAGVSAGSPDAASTPEPAGSSTRAAPGADLQADTASDPGSAGVAAALSADARRVIEGLTVNVVSYSEVPERRFVMLDQRIFRESEAVAEGIVVKRILPGGALLAAGRHEVMVRPD